MKFQVTNGLNKISIGSSEVGDYFYFKKPLIATWREILGTVGKYLCLLPYDEEYRNQVENYILSNLDSDYTNKPEELIELLNPLFKLFRNGEYEMNYYHSSDNSYFEHSSISDGIHYTKTFSWRLLFSKPIGLDYKEVINQYRHLIEEAEDKGLDTQDIIPISDSYFGSLYEELFIATQPESVINIERVKYFEEQIKSGSRPFAIIFDSSIKVPIKNTENRLYDYRIHDYCLKSNSYILDGHHKLMAYYNLKINPSLAIITYLPKNREEVEFNMEELIEVLYPWQIEHILENWSNKEEHIAKFLGNTDSKIHQFYKNGYHQTFHLNGQIKNKAFYVNNKRHGLSTWWYNDGKLGALESFENGIFIGGEGWYQSGLPRYKVNTDIDEYYYKNGQLYSKKEWVENQTIKLSRVWYENGQLQNEKKSNNSYNTLSNKYYDREGTLVSFEEFDPIENRVVKRI